MNQYEILNHHELFTPALVFYPDLIRANTQAIIAMAGGAQRLCPHVKTHKCPEVVKIQLDLGIASHKCATIAEAEMLATAGAKDILLAYPLVGPNVERLQQLARKFPEVRWGALCDHPSTLPHMQAVWQSMPQPLDVLMDVDIGHHRTGIAPGRDATALYEQISKTPGLHAAGFHVYDGHNHQESLDERRQAVLTAIEPVLAMRADLEQRGIPVARWVCGGTPTFPVWAKLNLPGQQCSPGTFVLYDHGYGSRYAELATLRPAAVVVSRVISKPIPGRLTTDLGHKAIAADPPAGKRCILLNVDEFQPAMQNEEHFAIDLPGAERWQIGDLIYAVPAHICPTVALHRAAYIAENQRIVGQWRITARDRVITI
jgi:D-serine deaminase-like pyridoxal phosphate-dependent protein